MRFLLRSLGLSLLAALWLSPAYGRSLRDQLPDAARLVGLQGGSAFDALADALADTAARNLPVVTASAGFTYRYNPALEVFERTSDTLGPIFLERPDTLGQGKLNVNVSYQYVQLDRVNGVPANELEASNPIVVRAVDAAGNLVGFTADRLRYRFRLINHIVGLNVTYGILDDLDVNVLLPIITTSFDVTARSRQVAAAGADGAFVPQAGPSLAGTINGDHAGVGDILLRGKYQFPRLRWFRSAFGLQLRFPSGSKSDLQGTGSFEMSPFLYWSTILWGRVEPNANLGFDLRTDDVSRSDWRYDFGVDVDVTRRIGVALGFLGRSAWARSSPAGQTSFLHLTGAGPREQPLLGIDFGRKDQFDLSFGTRVVVWRQLMVFLNGIYALNDQGLRSSNVIPTLGVEGTF